jgi:hypothetical protein
MKKRHKIRNELEIKNNNVTDEVFFCPYIVFLTYSKIVNINVNETSNK